MRERCLTCMCWHEPDEHKPAPPPPEVLTGQVLDSSCIAHTPVSGNPDE